MLYSYVVRHEITRLEPHAFANLSVTKKQSQAYRQVFSLVFLGKNSRTRKSLKLIGKTALQDQLSRSSIHAIARVIARNVRSEPSSSSVSPRGGETVFPVIATRIGWAIFPIPSS